VTDAQKKSVQSRTVFVGLERSIPALPGWGIQPRPFLRVFTARREILFRNVTAQGHFRPAKFVGKQHLSNGRTENTAIFRQFFVALNTVPVFNAPTFRTSTVTINHEGHTS
jgi:hypothetical protein